MDVANNLQAIKDIIQGAIQDGMIAVDTGVSVIYHKNVDFSLAAEATSCYMNDSWMGTIKKLLEDGFEIVRVQTEIGLNGHNTMVYLVKLRQN